MIMRRFCFLNASVSALGTNHHAPRVERQIHSHADFHKFDAEPPSSSVSASSTLSSSSSPYAEQSNKLYGDLVSVTSEETFPEHQGKKVIPLSVWTPQQHSYRSILRSLRGAYYNDRARLFWARHFARIEFYKYEKFFGEGDVRQKAAQDKLLKEMIKSEEEEKARELKASSADDLEDLLGMGSTTEEELATHAQLAEANNDESGKNEAKADQTKEEEEEDPFVNVPISTAPAIGSLNSAENIVYTYARHLSSPSPQHQHLVNLANECADFIDKYMKISVERIVEHNEVMMSLSVSDAKKFRKAYVLREEQHESWCKQKIRQILDRRPLPPFPYC